jgi:hypothetical protein
VFILRQAASNNTAAMPAPVLATTAPAAVTPLSSLPPLAEAPSNSLSETIEPERPLNLEPPPIQIGVPQQASLEAVLPPLSTVVTAPGYAPPLVPRDRAGAYEVVPVPPHRPLEFAPPPTFIIPSTRYDKIPSTRYDKQTAIYDISAHTVYLPGGMRLEAHSGLGDRMDDPRYVDERDRGATPPHLYELTLRESLFHGVQALRLTPIGDGFFFNRVGLLAHPYMLGPNGDSNGCVSFKNYDIFLHAFMSGEVKRLAVVARWTEDGRQVGPLASLRQALDR